MKIGILSKREVKLTEKMKIYFESLGHEIRLYTPNNLYINESLLKNDFYILKSKKLIYLYAGCYLNKKGIPVIPEPNISYKQRNRREAHLLLKKAGLNSPKFYTGATAKLKQTLKTEEYPFVLKPVMGSGGAGIKVINSKRDFSSKDDKIIFVEQYIEGTHYNVCFIGDEICAYIKPPLSTNDIPMECIAVADDIEGMVNKWKKDYDILFGHLDMVREHDSDKVFVVDVGPFPQFYNWEFDENPAPKICDLILQRLKRLKS